jgi:Ca2+-binding EF-hand superfamily protein
MLLNKAMSYIKYIVKTKRMLIKIPFQDFDKTNTGHVTKEQFTRVLTTLNINFDEKTYDVLARKYMDKG